MLLCVCRTDHQRFSIPVEQNDHSQTYLAYPDGLMMFLPCACSFHVQAFLDSIKREPRSSRVLAQPPQKGFQAVIQAAALAASLATPKSQKMQTCSDVFLYKVPDWHKFPYNDLYKVAAESEVIN